jgi:heptosyltransferase-3
MQTFMKNELCLSSGIGRSAWLDDFSNLGSKPRMIFASKNSPVRQILVINMSHIGGVLLMTPALELLRKLYPAAEISALVRDDAGMVLQGNPLVAHIYTDGKITSNQKMHLRTKASFRQRLKQIPRGLKLLTALRRKRFDLAVHFTDSDRGAFCTFLSGARQRVGWRARSGFWSKNCFYTHLCPHPEKPEHKVLENFHMVCHLATLPTEAGLNPGPLAFNPVAEDLSWAQTQWQTWDSGNNLRVVVHPVSRVLYKCWEPEKWTALIEKIQNDFNATVLVTSGPEAKEIKIGAQIANACQRKIHARLGDLSLGQLAALIRHADLFLGVDTAPMHIAAAVGARVIAIFGPSNDEVWSPWGAGHRVIRRPCPCLKSGVRRCQEYHGMDCLKELTVEEVYCAAKDVLQK